jgi:hypothetical protein
LTNSITGKRNEAISSVSPVQSVIHTKKVGHNPDICQIEVLEEGRITTGSRETKRKHRAPALHWSFAVHHLFDALIQLGSIVYPIVSDICDNSVIQIILLFGRESKIQSFRDLHAIEIDFSVGVSRTKVWLMDRLLP